LYVSEIFLQTKNKLLISCSMNDKSNYNFNLLQIFFLICLIWHLAFFPFSKTQPQYMRPKNILSPSIFDFYNGSPSFKFIRPEPFHKSSLDKQAITKAHLICRDLNSGLVLSGNFKLQGHLLVYYKVTDLFFAPIIRVLRMTLMFRSLFWTFCIQD